MDTIVLVDVPALWPCACIFCGSQKGPQADTGVERNGEHIYACKRCVMTLSGAFGFVKGEKMEELSRAVDELAARDRQIGAHAERIEVLTSELGDARRRGEALNTLLEQERARLQTAVALADQIHESGRQLAGVVGG